MHDLPPLKSLRVFEACIRLGNFTRAARELNVGQPAISHQIHALERDLNVQLFERKGSLTVPTAEALSYYQTIANGLSDIARASAKLRRNNRQDALTLATYPGIAMFWLMARLERVRRLYPDLAVRVTTAERDQDIPLEEVDCAILFGSGDWSGYESRLLMQEIVVPVAAPALASRLAGVSRAEMLAQGPLIHLEDREQRWFTWSDWRDLKSPDSQNINAGITVTNHGIAIHQTLMGYGIGLGWSGVIDEMIENGLLIAMDSEPISSERGYFLVARQDFLHSKIGRLVIQSLVDQETTSRGNSL
ncbi:LysR substrate-binding domain-containing protein [Mesorhizobium sp. B2-7-1]|uniref:LysR substrate-binding domain-containing protein n=1 Tax=Mesorhizobium sp. B2-7-1 TaxID=2589909 RepID=UPI00112ADFA1|nr:LysR substrate-binding domain-containing protein [Mesorhizobium sp. B2-7-1]TPJ54204.1 LysR family transcriptional regulator [Mesorhizobium sp. B2-7-1]